MSKEVTYDTTDQVDVIKGHPLRGGFPSANGQTGLQVRAFLKS